MRIVTTKGGLIIQGDLFGCDHDLIEACRGAALAVLDPPYGNIVSDYWDKLDDEDLARNLAVLFGDLSAVMLDGSHACLWGGFGSPGNRSFFRSILAIEGQTDWQMAALNTWRKKRAYGTKWRCLAAREEMARFVLGDIKKPRAFNIQFTEHKRGYKGFNKNHPAKSEYKRLTMVWDHASDMTQNKPHKCLKPEPLARTQIGMCTNEGDTVLDLFAGSGELSRVAREMGREFVAIENDPATFERLVEYLT